ncbi:MAG TPA: hypothetical protein VJ898_02940, partial [Natrialbaceae archaeon]|nr:hypothetical protein [Natrialbaceae archaeon]
TAADLHSRNVGSDTLNGLLYGFLSLIPPVVLHGTMFVLPNWVSPLGAAGTLVVAATLVLWLLLEVGRFAYRRFEFDRFDFDRHA